MTHRSFALLLMSAATLSVAACSQVPAGNVGIKFNKYGSDKGIDLQELGPGRYWTGVTWDMYTFPTFMQNYTWTKAGTPTNPVDESMSFQTSEGLSVNADIGITYQLDKSKITKIFQTYRRGVDEITDTFLRNMVRDELNKQASVLPIEAVYGRGKASLIEGVEHNVKMQVAPIGIVIDRIYWINDLRLPPTVTAAINAKIQATQMAQQRENEVAQATAEAQKAVAEAHGLADSKLLIATADAQAIKIRGEALRDNPSLVQLNAVDKWDGHMPQYMLSGAMPLLNLNAK
jgi:regulator of protease activity HflC (stomatin/prohibitin superfamily)